jgi:hypothetical protein
MYECPSTKMSDLKKYTSGFTNAKIKQVFLWTLCVLQFGAFAIVGFFLLLRQG